MPPVRSCLPSSQAGAVTREKWSHGDPVSGLQSAPAFGYLHSSTE